MYGRVIRQQPGMSSVAVFLILGSMLVACGGTTKSTTPPSTSTNPSSATSAAMINIGDSPSDQVVAFAMTINSMTLTGNNGTVTVLSSPTTVEMMRLSGSGQPLSLTNVPQGTYTSAAINTGSAVVSFMNPGNPVAVSQTVSVPATTVTFSSPIMIGTTPVVFNFDMDMTKSVNITGGTISVTPSYVTSMGAPGSGNPQDPENGAVHVLGSVSGTPVSSSFVMSMMQSSETMTFSTNSSTQFQTMNGSAGSMAMMTSGQIVTVDAIMQPDGTLLAQSVHSRVDASGGVVSEGIMQSMSGNTVSLIAQNGTGSGMTAAMLGNGIGVNAAGATFTAETDGVDMSGLPFSATAFNSSTISPAERIQASSTSAMGPGGSMMMGGMTMTGSMTAREMRLIQQGFSGTVSAFTPGSPSTFTMTLDPNSAFATLTGKTTMTVYQQNDTELRGLSSIANGAQVHVRGLMFHNVGGYQMVASRITST